MDQQLKARLIGASVLVLIAVLLIPELLSGRKAGTSSAPVADSARGTRTYTIDLSGATATGPGPSTPAPNVPAPPAATSRANATPGSTAPSNAPTTAAATAPTRAREQGAPANSGDDAASVDSPAVARADGTGANTTRPTVAATVAPPVAAPAAAERAEAATTTGARAGWSVQVGAFSSSATAGRLVGELRQDGYDAYVAPLQRSGKTLHRVRVGPEDSRAAAERLAGRLQAKKLPATVVAND